MGWRHRAMRRRAASVSALDNRVLHHAADCGYAGHSPSGYGGGAWGACVKATVWSWLPYALSLGLLAVFAVLGAPRSTRPRRAHRQRSWA